MSNFRKTNISYPLISTRTCAYQGVRNVRFSGNLTCFVFLKTRFEIYPVAVLPTNYYWTNVISNQICPKWVEKFLIFIMNNPRFWICFIYNEIHILNITTTKCNRGYIHVSIPISRRDKRTNTWKYSDCNWTRTHNH